MTAFRKSTCVPELQAEPVTVFREKLMLLERSDRQTTVRHGYPTNIFLKLSWWVPFTSELDTSNENCNFGKLRSFTGNLTVSQSLTIDEISVNGDFFICIIKYTFARSHQMNISQIINKWCLQSCVGKRSIANAI